MLQAMAGNFPPRMQGMSVLLTGSHTSPRDWETSSKFLAVGNLGLVSLGYAKCLNLG